jgi:hypothetical protein
MVDRISNSPDYRTSFSPEEVGKIVKLTPQAVRVIYREMHIGEKVDGRIRFSAEDVVAIQKRQNTLHHHIRRDAVNMSKLPARPVGFDPVAFKMFENCMNKIQDIERKMYNKEDHFSYWNRFGDIQKTFNGIGDRLDSLEDRLRALVKLVQQSPPGDQRGRGVSILGRTAPLTLSTADEAA